jgi:hypothetical protein
MRHANKYPSLWKSRTIIVPDDFPASAFKHADGSAFARVKDRNDQARAGSARWAKNCVVALDLFAQALSRIGSIHCLLSRLHVRPGRQGG